MAYVNLKLSDADAIEKKDSSGVDPHCHQGVVSPTMESRQESPGP